MGAEFLIHEHARQVDEIKKRDKFSKGHKQLHDRKSPK